MYPGECQYAQLHLLATKVSNKNESDVRKIDYLLHGKELRRLVQSINPDIIHAHYVSSYGSMCSLAGITPFWLSIWGSDIYEFPGKGFPHKLLVKNTLKKAHMLLSTSKAMAREIGKYTDRKIEITPFGVDMKLFTPEKRTRINDGKFVVGTVKALEKKYGIDDLLRASAIVLEKRKDIPLEVRIAGTGTMKSELKYLSNHLDLAKRVHWLGQIPQAKAAVEWANMDVAIVASESESFGVSAVEAEASGLPVIISDIPGLMEATAPGKTSLVVKRKFPEQIAEKIIWLYDNPIEAKKIGIRGREFVEKKYEFNHCFEIVEKLYIEDLKRRSK